MLKKLPADDPKKIKEAVENIFKSGRRNGSRVTELYEDLEF
jgi:hypothetical protein